MKLQHPWTTDQHYAWFLRPGCDTKHAVSTGAGGWQWNGDVDRPTLSPSVLVRCDGADAGVGGAPPAVCHSFVADGCIQFLSYCTHALAGHRVDLSEIEA